MSAGSGPVTVSTMLDPIESFLNKPAEQFTEDDILLANPKELKWLLEAVEETLEKDAKAAGNDPNAVTPIGNSLDWTPDWLFGLIDEHNAYHHLILIEEKLYLPVRRMTSGTFPNESPGSPEQRYLDVERMLTWCKEYAPLIRSGVVYPLDPSFFTETDTLKQMALEATYGVDVKSFNAEALSYEEQYSIASFTEKDIHEYAGMKLLDLYKQLFCAKKWSSAPAFTTPPTLSLYELLSQKLGGCTANRPSDRVRNTLQRLELPNLKSLPVSEVAALRANSEAFATWRNHIRRALLETSRRVDEGDDLERAFREQIQPLTDLVAGIEKDVKTADASVMSKAKSSFVCGLSSWAVTAQIASLLGMRTSLEVDLLKLAVGSAAPLIPAFFSKPKTNSNKVISDTYRAIF